MYITARFHVVAVLFALRPCIILQFFALATKWHPRIIIIGRMQCKSLGRPASSGWVYNLNFFFGNSDPSVSRNCSTIRPEHDGAVNLTFMIWGVDPVLVPKQVQFISTFPHGKCSRHFDHPAIILRRYESPSVFFWPKMSSKSNVNIKRTRNALSPILMLCACRAYSIHYSRGKIIFGLL